MLVQTHRSLLLDSKLYELNLYQVGIDSNTIVADVSRLLESHPLIPGIILMRQTRFEGMISRQRFFEYMSRPLSRELFYRKPLFLLLQFTRTHTLTFSGDTSIVVAARQAWQRPPALVYEPIVVHLQAGEYQLLDVHQLLVAQSQIQELTMLALQQSQQALTAEKELAQTTLHSIADAVITTDAAGKVQALNPVAEQLTGWTTTAARGLTLQQVFRTIYDQSDYSAPTSVLEAIHDGQTLELANEIVLLARNGQQYAIHGSVAPIQHYNGKVSGAVLVFRDVTRERNLSRQLSWQAAHDALTGLVNRRQFEHRLEQAYGVARQENQQHTLCCMDLDRFKLVNDTCGHLAGDELLRQLTTLLQRRVRKTDTLARLGGDEFGLLLERCSLEQGLKVAQGVHQCVNEFQFIWQEQPFKIGISIGVTVIDAETPSFTIALSRADAACYCAKKQGRNQISVYDPQCDC